MPSMIPPVRPAPVRVGHRTVVPLLDAVGPGPLAADVYPWLAPARLAELLDTHGGGHRDPAGTRLRMAVQGFAILGAGRTILVDTCLGGPKPGRPAPLPGFSSRWLSTLRETGVEPTDVDTVVTTHLHHDHVGWHTSMTGAGRLVPTFPHARYLVTGPEHEHVMDPRVRAGLAGGGGYVADALRPVAEAGQLDVVPADHRIDGEVRLLPAPGHTPGHVVVEIDAGGRTVAVVADLLHHPLQLAEPDIRVGLSADPETDAATRRTFLDRYANTDAVVLFSHLPVGGRIRRHGPGYALVG